MVAAFAGAYARDRPASGGHRCAAPVRVGTHANAGGRGHLRVGVDDDAVVVANWAEGFVTETGFGSADDVAMMVARLRSGLIRLWVDGDEPVAMGVGMPVVLGVSRVGWIYTPPGHRARATARR